MENKLSQNLKYLRVKTGRSQTDIGLYVKKAHTSIGNWEKGIAEPSLKEIEMLASFFEITPAELLYTDLDNTNNEGPSKTNDQKLRKQSEEDYKTKYIALLEKINREQALLIDELKAELNDIKGRQEDAQAKSSVA